MVRSPVLLFAFVLGFVPMRAADRPNLVLILADDLGSGDLPAFGATDLETPHLDRIAAEGMRFTGAYANGPECTPSRTAILTGRHPHRAGGLGCPIGTGNVGRYDDAIRLRESDDLGLPSPMAVLAPGLKRAGYATALIGKWHPGYEPKFNPLDQGFDQHSCFETSMLVPLIVRAPGFAGGVRTEALTELIDLYPTLSELAGLPVPPHVQGRSFVPLMRDPAAPWKEPAIGRFTNGDNIRTDTVRFTEYTDRELGPVARMLYDRNDDPAEHVNVSEHSTNEDLVGQLTQHLRDGKGE